MRDKTIFSLVFIAGVFVPSTSQILLKKSAEFDYYVTMIKEY